MNLHYSGFDLPKCKQHAACQGVVRLSHTEAFEVRRDNYGVNNYVGTDNGQLGASTKGAGLSKDKGSKTRSSPHLSKSNNKAREVSHSRIRVPLLLL